VDPAGQRGEGKNSGGRCQPWLGPAQEGMRRERKEKGARAGEKDKRAGGLTGPAGRR
jgi:hypothetical protein